MIWKCFKSCHTINAIDFLIKYWSTAGAVYFVMWFVQLFIDCWTHILTFSVVCPDQLVPRWIFNTHSHRSLAFSYLSRLWVKLCGTKNMNDLSLFRWPRCMGCGESRESPCTAAVSYFHTKAGINGFTIWGMVLNINLYIDNGDDVLSVTTHFWETPSSSNLEKDAACCSFLFDEIAMMYSRIVSF